MATTGLAAANTVIPVLNSPIAVPQNTYAATPDRAERAVPLRELREMEGVEGMEGSPELRHRTTHGRPLSNGAENDESSLEPAEGATPRSTDTHEQDKVAGTAKVSPTTSLLRSLSNLVKEGPFARRAETLKDYNEKQGYNRFKYAQLDKYPEGYPQLAAFINSNDNFAIFRRFGELFARTLLQLQVDLTELETELHNLDKADNENPAMAYRLRGWEDFKEWNNDQRKLQTRIVEKLSEYSDLLLKDSQLRALGSAPARNHYGLYNWMWSHKPLGDDKDGFILHVEDFVSAANQSAKGGPLRDLLEMYLERWPQSRIKSHLQTETELKRTQDPYVDYYAPTKLANFVKAVSVSLAVSILLVPVFLLFLVPMSREAMAWMVCGFVISFAVTISALTDAKAQEVLIGTAAYAAVLVTFLGNMNHGAGIKSASA